MFDRTWASFHRWMRLRRLARMTFVAVVAALFLVGIAEMVLPFSPRFDDFFLPSLFVVASLACLPFQITSNWPCPCCQHLFFHRSRFRLLDQWGATATQGIHCGLPLAAATHAPLTPPFR